MTIRDWLIVAGIVILLGVMADLVRRYLQRGRLRLAIDDQFRDMPEVDLSAELPNGGARLVSDPSAWAGSAASASQTEVEADEPEWKIDPLLTGVSSRDGEVDLLLEQEFKGVGEGADRWLSQSGHTRDEPLDDLDDGILSSARVVKAAVEEPKPVKEPLPVKEPQPEQEPQSSKQPELAEQTQPQAQSLPVDAREPQQQFAESTRIGAAVVVESELSDVDAGVDNDELLVDPLLDPQAEVAEPEALTDIGKPGFTVVKAESDIDLERPVHELLQEQQALQSSQSTDSVEELEVLEPVVEPEPKPKKPAATRNSKATQNKRERRAEEQTSFFDLHPDLAPDVDLPEPVVKPKRRRRKNVESVNSTTASQQEQTPLEEEVLILNVKAKNQPFPGALLFKLLNACGMVHGEMDIFHRHEGDDGRGALQFSMANAVAPGTFDPGAADGFSTPAVTFFLRLVDPTDRMNALECMLATAQCVADNLNGELKDENRSSIRGQTIEHYRQKVREFERKLLTRSS